MLNPTAAEIEPDLKSNPVNIEADFGEDLRADFIFEVAIFQALDAFGICREIVRLRIRQARLDNEAQERKHVHVRNRAGLNRRDGFLCQGFERAWHDEIARRRVNELAAGFRLASHGKPASGQTGLADHRASASEIVVRAMEDRVAVAYVRGRGKQVHKKLILELRRRDAHAPRDVIESA